MLINRESLYTLRIIYYLSKQDKNRIIPGREISDSENISINFTFRILGILVKKGIVESFKGNKGGFRLKKKSLNFYEIINLIQKDPFTLIMEGTGEVETFIREVQENLKNTFKNKTI